MKPKEILHQLNTGPKRRFGQNFLIDESVIETMVEAAQVSKEDSVVEVGPGLGALTEKLSAQAKKVIAVEADRDMAEFLTNRNLPNVTVVNFDALRLDWAVSIEGDYKIVANIPFSITSPLIRKIFALHHQPIKTVLLVQKEVAQRLSAKPGDSNRGFLTLLVEAQGSVQLLRTVKPGSFYPAPKVDSAIIELKITDNKTDTIFWPAIEVAFTHKRQTLVNSLTNNLHLPKTDVTSLIENLGLNPMVRPSELTFDNWQALSAALMKEKK